MHARLAAVVTEHAEVRCVLEAILTRSEQGGHLPHRITLEASAAAADVLRRVFSARAVTVSDRGCVRIDLAAFRRASGMAAGELAGLLRAALGGPGSGSTASAPKLRSSAILAEVERELSSLLRVCQRGVSRRFVEAEVRSLALEDSPACERALRLGATKATELVRRVVLSLDALPQVKPPVRVQNFAARVLGDSKALSRQGELAKLVGAALADHDPTTRRALEEQGVPPHRSTEIARALEVHGIFHDEVAASVLCFGPLVYDKRGERFDHVLRHSRFGESSRLTVHQLRDAKLLAPRVRRATVFENLTPYLDYVDACAGRGIDDELVLCSAGQASFAVVQVLSGLAAHGVPVRHCGDLDRSGVLILRSLQRRSGARITPLLMDSATLARFADRARPLSSEERRRLAQALGKDSTGLPCHDLLCSIHRTGRWIEQEQYVEECLEELLI